MKKGNFISLEGPEGSGKTSLINFLKDFLEENKLDVILTREPGGVSISEQIRNVILNTSNTTMDGRTEALLYAAARRQLLVEKIIPDLENGKTILCDRFVDSSLVYQGFARGIGFEEVFQVNQFAINGYMPNLTLYLDIEPEKGLRRIQVNKEREVNRLDLETLDFHNKVREGYLKLVERFPERIVLINADQSPEKVFADVKEVLLERIFKN